MDRLSLLATAVTQPDQAMQPHHPLAGVGHAAASFSSQLDAPAPPPAPPQPYLGAFAPSTLMSQSPNSPDSLLSFEHTGPSTGGTLAGSSQPGTANGSARGQKKTARRTSQAGDDEAEHDADGQHSRKRTKQSLSCGECKRRKIKCDRKIPCTSCLKRGDAESCNWEDAKIEPEKQPFALATETDELRLRLSLVERFINKLPEPLKISFKHLGISYMGELPRADLKKEHMTFIDTYPTGPLPEGSKVAPHDSLGVIDNILFVHLKDQGVDGLEQPDKRDLTRMLTSIVAPRVVYTSPSISTNLGLDPCFSQEELDAARLRSLDRIYAQLPGRRECKDAVDGYFAQFDWFFSILHHKTWWAEFDRFWEMCEQGRKYEVDPAWLAVFFLILALSSDESMNLGSPSIPEASSAWEEQSARYHACAQKLIHLADPFGRPQARMLQITTFLACWTLISAHGGEFGRFSSWFACGVRTAQKMGLHQLSDDPENMPPDDPAWPPGQNALKRETALRLWGFMTFFDHLSASAHFKAYMIHPSHTTTPLLSNINWQDLSPTETKSTPAPRSVLTDSSMEYHKVKLSSVSRKTFDLLIAGSDTFNYGTILELDQDYRDLLANLPDVWQYECASLEMKDPIVRRKRYIALQGTHNRLVRLHRPFLVKGWDPDSKFAYSADACVRSARAVVLSHHNNLDINRNLRMMYSHTLSAAIVLAADLYHAIDEAAPDAEIENKKSTFALSLDIFSQEIQDSVASRHLRSIINAGRRVLTGLYNEQARRRTRSYARRAAGDTSPSGERTFAEILHNYAREMDTRAGPDSISAGQVTAGDTGHYDVPPVTPLPATATPATMAPSLGPDLSAWYPGASPAANGVPLPTDQGGSFSSNLLADMGLINMGGQQWDYWSQNGGGTGASGIGSTPQPGAGNDRFGPADAAGIDLSAFLGGGAGVNTQDAAQLLLNQLTGGW